MSEETVKKCYHCDQPSRKGLTVCERWRIHICDGCKRNHHQPCHDSCQRAVEEKFLRPALLRKKLAVRTFQLVLSGYQGVKIRITSPLGTSFKIEDHVDRGSYITHSGGLSWVAESKYEISLLIIKALYRVN